VIVTHRKQEDMSSSMVQQNDAFMSLLFHFIWNPYLIKTPSETRSVNILSKSFILSIGNGGREWNVSLFSSRRGGGGNLTVCVVGWERLGQGG
jgi:hypothetical protein